MAAKTDTHNQKHIPNQQSNMESIEVILRIRPMNQFERDNRDIEVWTTQASDIVGISAEKYSDLIRLRKIAPGQKTQYLFNRCFEQKTTNAQIYEQVVKRIAISSLKGINGTIFMYGQTGSGKTFTMMGSNKDDYNINNIIIIIIIEMVLNSQDSILVEFSDYHLPNGLIKHISSSSAGLLGNATAFLKPQALSSNSPLCRGRASSSIHKSQGSTPEKQTYQIKTSLPQGQCDEILNVEENSFCNEKGILALSLEDIFNEMSKAPERQYLLRCSYVEIYTDFVYDLLQSREKLGETLSICEDYNKEFFVKGALEQMVDSIQEIMSLLNYGEQNRHYASTAMNHVSSRSHTIFRLYVRSMPLNFKNSEEGITESILNFVDLAGSEKISSHQIQSISNNNSTNISNSKERQIESKTINKSLFFLTQVITLKSAGKQEQFIPYRNSPLTKILRSSLGGNSRTAIVLCLNPCLSQLEQSASTLRFGLQAKKIENRVRQNFIQMRDQNVLQNLVKDYESRIQELEQETILNRVNSDNLLKMIQQLIQQKNSLQLQIKSTTNNQCSRQSNLIHTQYNTSDFMHIDNVGLIKINFNGKRSLGDTNDKKDEGKIEQLEKLLRDKQKAQLKMEIKLKNKKKKLHSLKQSQENLGNENSRLKQELALYKNLNLEGLRKLSLNKLHHLEQNAELLLKNIRNQSNLLTITKELKADNSTLDKIGKSFQLQEQRTGLHLELDTEFYISTNLPVVNQNDDKCNNSPSVPIILTNKDRLQEITQHSQKQQIAVNTLSTNKSSCNIIKYDCQQEDIKSRPSDQLQIQECKERVSESTASQNTIDSQSRLLIEQNYTNKNNNNNNSGSHFLNISGPVAQKKFSTLNSPAFSICPQLASSQFISNNASGVKQSKTYVSPTSYSPHYNAREQIIITTSQNKNPEVKILPPQSVDTPTRQIGISTSEYLVNNLTQQLASTQFLSLQQLQQDSSNQQSSLVLSKLCKPDTTDSQKQINLSVNNNFSSNESTSFKSNRPDLFMQQIQPKLISSQMSQFFHSDQSLKSNKQDDTLQGMLIPTKDTPKNGLRSNSHGCKLSNHLKINDINTQALALQQDFQEPSGFDSLNKNRTESFTKRAIKLSDQTIKMPSSLLRENRENKAFPEKKLMDKLFDKENKSLIIDPTILPQQKLLSWQNYKNSSKNQSFKEYQPSFSYQQNPSNPKDQSSSYILKESRDNCVSQINYQVQQISNQFNTYNSSNSNNNKECQSQASFSQSIKKNQSSKDILGAKFQFIINSGLSSIANSENQHFNQQRNSMGHSSITNMTPTHSKCIQISTTGTRPLSTTSASSHKIDDNFISHQNIMFQRASQQS